MPDKKGRAAVVAEAADKQRAKAEKPGTTTLTDVEGKPTDKVDVAVLERLEKSLKAAKGRAGEAQALLEAWLLVDGHGQYVEGAVNAHNVRVAVNCTCPLCVATLAFLGREPKTAFP